MKEQRTVLLLLLLLSVCLGTYGQQRNKRLTISVTSVEGDRLGGQPITLTQTDYAVSYGNLQLDANGQCQLNVFSGNHRLSIEREGFNPLQHDFTVADDDAEASVSVTLAERTRQPYALSASVLHNAYDGTNQLQLRWNTEQPAFFDDFEQYEPWAVSFGQWTGIDADQAAAAPLLGSYPNRGVMQYAQIINPLTVEPTWWYDYPILRPYDGQQYVGFTRTNTGQANDDWLISPVISVGTDNVLQFMGKAADQFQERFMVYVTTQVDNPVQSDFVRLDQGNFETADYRGWHQYTYDLSAYAGQKVKVAVRYISDYNRYGSFMLMVDNVYVGQPAKGTSGGNARRRSPDNPNEQFTVYLDGEPVGTTDGYDYIINNVSDGDHTVGVRACYIASQSELTTAAVSVAPAGDYARVSFSVTANSILSPDGQQLMLVSRATAQSYTLTVSNGAALMQSLPRGGYELHVEQGAFEALSQSFTVGADTTVNVSLTDRIIDPWNITATLAEDHSLTLRWNQELGFADSFEDYDDFATGSFGQWITIDQDQQPVYPIALGTQTNIVSFPGSGTASNPTAIAPMVFNPWMTQPAMLPTDPAIAAPTGQKTVIFFSPQRTKADKWLISPLLTIRPGYELHVTAKGYSSMYPESMEFCVSQGSQQPSDFTPVSQVSPLSSEQWTIYATDLSEWAGQQVRLAVHYTSTDAFLAQIDDFTVGPVDGQGETVDYGNVVRFDVWLDGQLIGSPTQPLFVISPLAEGTHVVGIRAIYKDGQSALVEYEVQGPSAIATLKDMPQLPPTGIYDLQGRRVNCMQHGVFVRNGKKLVY